jgi:hypothetical protein
VESILGPLGTAATPGLLYLPRVIVKMGKLVEWTVLAGETEVLGENLPRRHFAYHKSHLSKPGANPGRRGGKPTTNSFSYGAAASLYLHMITNSTEKEPSRRSSSRSTSQEIPRLVSNPNGSITSSQEPATCPYPKLHESNPHPIGSLLKASASSSSSSLAIWSF